MNSLANKLPKTLNLQQLNSRAPIFVSILLILASSYSLSQITWLLIPSDDNPVARASNSTSSRRPVTNKQPQYAQRINQAHLFGLYQQKQTAEAINTDAPETRLNLVLRGLFAANPMNRASAIIAIGKRGKEDIYGINDKISGATIKEIHTDRVVLERNGRYETLRMPKDFTKGRRIKSKYSGRKARVSASDSPGRILSNIRKNILKNPTSFGQYAMPIPYKVNGRLKGYRLKPQGDNSLFDAVGLQANDVVTRVNGISLNRPSNGLSALRKLQNAKQVNITVLRNGAEIPLSIDIP